MLTIFWFSTINLFVLFFIQIIFFFTKSFFSKNSNKLVYCFPPQLSRLLFPVVSLWFYFKCYFFNQKPAKFFQFSNFPNLFNFQFWSEKTNSVHLFFPINFFTAQILLRDCSPLPSEGFCLQSVCKILPFLLVLTCKQPPLSSIFNCCVWTLSNPPRYRPPIAT